MADRIPLSDPWITRYSTTSLLHHPSSPSSPESITTSSQETYGHPFHPILFRIGNGGAGYTGLLRVLCERFIASRSPESNNFRIGWVSNHSRHTQIALLADVVQVALTYEPENEDVAVREGWCARVGRGFNDHFVLVGPVDGKLERKGGIVEAMRGIADSNAPTSSSRERWKFNSRGDGSATFAKELHLWNLAGIDASSSSTAAWIRTHPSTPYDALLKANQDSAFLLTDRATFLTAKRDGVIPRLKVHVEGGKELLNPCSVLVREGEVAKGEGYEVAKEFASWLVESEEVRRIVEGFGREWGWGKPLFTVAEKEEFDAADGLVE